MSLLAAGFVAAAIGVAAHAQPEPDESPEPEAESRQPDAEAAPEPSSPLTDEQIIAIRAQYDAADSRGRAELLAYYKDFGVNLIAVLGITESEAQQRARADMIVQQLQQMQITRAPRDVLSMRAQLVTDTAFPDPGRASEYQIAAWIQRRAIAGDWQSISVMLGAMPSDSASMIASALLSILSQNNAGLLPEEVLDVAAIIPGAPTPQNVASLARMLGPAARRHGTVALMRRIQQGDARFGLGTPEMRRTTLSLLEQADLIAEAYDYLPPLDPARAAGDALVVTAHARYMDENARRLAEGPEKDSMRRRAFELYAETTTFAETSSADVRDAIQRAFALMPWLPRSMVDPWLAGLFTDAVRTRIAAEVLAFEADKLRDSDLTPRERANAVIGLARSAEAMLKASAGDPEGLRIPLSVLANAVSEQMELALASGDNANRRLMPQRRQRLGVLMQATPSADWLDAVGPSVAVRVTRAVMMTAVDLERLDEAIDHLTLAVERSPADGPALAEHLLSTWGRWLADQNTAIDDDDYYYYYWAYQAPSQALTRAQQQRNLASLRRLIDIMRALGVDAKQLESTLGVFRACHQSDEVYRRHDIEAVFGDPRTLPVLTATSLADTIRSNVLAYWTAQVHPPQTGAQRKSPPPTAELKRQVNAAYDTAMQLISFAREKTAGDWRVEAVAASVGYDRLQLNQRLGLIDPAERVEILGEAFLAFQRAAVAYARALSRAEQVESADIYSRWFRAALGSSDISRLHVSQLPEEGSAGDEQFARIRDAMSGLPEDEWNRHLAAFADEIVAALSDAPAEAKPGLVRAALRVVGDHPSGAPLVKLHRFYRDLTTSDLKLALTIHGGSSVAAGKPFAALLSLRYTNAVERSAGDFGRYIQNNQYNYIRGSWNTRNYRDDLERQIRQAYSKGYEVQSIAWFQPSHPSRTVIQDQQDGWLEKPLALIYASPKDTAVDRLPQVSMQMYFRDGSGEAVVVLESNTPAIGVEEGAPHRPVTGLEVTQTIDTRNATDPRSPEILIEVSATGRGTVPELVDLLAGYERAVPGHTLQTENIETSPLIFRDPAARTTSGVAGVTLTPEEPIISELGFELPVVERSWRLTYIPDGTAAPGRVRLASLIDGLEGALINRAYGETDLIELAGFEYSYDTRFAWSKPLLFAAVMLGGVGAGVVYLRRRAGDNDAPDESRFRMPRRHTPMALAMTLRKWHTDAGDALDPGLREELERDIRNLEESIFGPNAHGAASLQLLQAMSKWEAALSRRADHVSAPA